MGQMAKLINKGFQEWNDGGEKNRELNWKVYNGSYNFIIQQKLTQ